MFKTESITVQNNQMPWNTKFDKHLFLCLQELYVNKDKLKLKYHISNLMMRRDFDNEDICRNQEKIPGFLL